jgi:tetratricopeptide (TPR) repeat protein
MLGLCDAELGLYQDATRILEPAFRRPHDPGMERLNGLELQKAYVELGDYGKASAVFDELLRRYPDDPEILFFSSRLYADRAEQSMERLALVAPESVWIARAKATVHEYQKEYDAATLEYRNAIRIDPTQPGLHFALGRVFLEKSSQSPSVSEALREFEQESELQPQNPDVEYEIGDCYRRLGDSGQALAHLSNAVQYNPNFAEAQIGLGRILIDLNRPKDALDHLLTAVHDDGNNEITHYLLFSDYRTLGNRVDAQRELETFRRLHKMRNAQEAPSQARGIVKQTLESGTMVEPE